MKIIATNGRNRLRRLARSGPERLLMMHPLRANQIRMCYPRTCVGRFYVKRCRISIGSFQFTICVLRDLKIYDQTVFDPDDRVHAAGRDESAAVHHIIECHLIALHPQVADRDLVAGLHAGLDEGPE